MKILFFISQERYKREAVDFCLSQLGGTDGELRVCYVLDEEFSSRVESFLCEATFVADKPSEDVNDALKLEYEQRANTCLQRLSTECKGKGVRCSTQLESGNYFDVIHNLTRTLSVDLVVVSEKRRSILAKWFGNSDAKTIKRRLSGVELRVF